MRVYRYCVSELTSSVGVKVKINSRPLAGPADPAEPAGRTPDLTVVGHSYFVTAQRLILTSSLFPLDISISSSINEIHESKG